MAKIDRAIAAHVRFGCVLADAGYGLSAPFRQGLTARGLAWAVGIPRHLKVYPVGVKLIWPVAMRGRPPSGPFRTSCRARPKTCWPTPSGKM
ncbi:MULTISPECIES: transposase [unclassified Bradyrhizobium]